MIELAEPRPAKFALWSDARSLGGGGGGVQESGDKCWFPHQQSAEGATAALLSLSCWKDLSAHTRTEQSQ